MELNGMKMRMNFLLGRGWGILYIISRTSRNRLLLYLVFHPPRVLPLLWITLKA